AVGVRAAGAAAGGGRGRRTVGGGGGGGPGAESSAGRFRGPCVAFAADTARGRRAALAETIAVWLRTTGWRSLAIAVLTLLAFLGGVLVRTVRGGHLHARVGAVAVAGAGRKGPGLITTADRAALQRCI